MPGTPWKQTPPAPPNATATSSATAAASTANCRPTTGNPSSAPGLGARADGQWYLHLFDKAQPDVNWKNPDIHEEFKKTLRFWSDHGTDGFRIDVAHGLAKDLESKPLEELGREYSVVGVLNHDFSHPLFDRREVHDIYREWRKVFNEYNPPRFAVAEAWVVPEHQHLYASMDELGQSSTSTSRRPTGMPTSSARPSPRVLRRRPKPAAPPPRGS